MAKPNLSDLFKTSFGIDARHVYVPNSNRDAKAPRALYKGLEIVDAKEAKKLSYLGLPIIFPIQFLADSYNVYNNDGFLESLPMSDFLLPLSCVVEFTRSKVMNTTKISGGYGSVKEIFGFDDWQINISGFLLPDPKQAQKYTTVIEQERELLKWEKIVSAIKIKSDLFAIREIHEIVISQIAFKTERGRPNVRPFTITAISDEPVELLISNS